MLQFKNIFCHFAYIVGFTGQAKIHSLLTHTDLCHRTLIQPLCRLGSARFPVTDEHFFPFNTKRIN